MRNTITVIINQSNTKSHFINSTTVLGKYTSVFVVSSGHDILFMAVLSYIDLNGSEDKYFANCDGLSFRMNNASQFAHR